MLFRSLAEISIPWDQRPALSVDGNLPLSLQPSYATCRIHLVPCFSSRARPEPNAASVGDSCRNRPKASRFRPRARSESSCFQSFFSLFLSFSISYKISSCFNAWLRNSLRSPKSCHDWTAICVHTERRRPRRKPDRNGCELLNTLERDQDHDQVFRIPERRSWRRDR